MRVSGLLASVSTSDEDKNSMGHEDSCLNKESMLNWQRVKFSIVELLAAKRRRQILSSVHMGNFSPVTVKKTENELACVRIESGHA